MYAHPGRKLMFMGCELAQTREWNHDEELDWGLLNNPDHVGVQRLVRDLNHLYRSHQALHARDDEPGGFKWIDVEDRAHSVFSFVRYGETAAQQVVVVCNLTPVVRHGYRLGVPQAGAWNEMLNTDSAHYGGSDVGNYGGVVAEPVPAHGQHSSVMLTLPPLGVLWLKPGAAL
jgi:1,4-alpha-glucan branching enzyme